MRTYQIQEADMKKKKIILTGAAVAAVVVIGIGAWALFGRTSSDGSTENVVYVNSVDNLMNQIQILQSWILSSPHTPQNPSPTVPPQPNCPPVSQTPPQQ